MVETVRELKELLAGMPDDALVLMCNPQWKVTQIEGHQLVHNSVIYEGRNVLYLDIKNFKR